MSSGQRRTAARASGDFADSELHQLLLEIATTAAPTGSEERRAALIERRWRGSGLDPYIDEVGNVVATLPGTGAGADAGPNVLVACHLDSVFAADVDLTVDQGEDRWVGPGIGDNAASLAVLTHWLTDLGDSPRPNLTLVATVGEEGVGDLKGARHAVAALADRHHAFIAADGYLGAAVNVGVGSRRYDARFVTKGGHSWGDYPSPSATHAAGLAISRLVDLHVPKEPRSSLNVGQIWGGTSINAIAERAGFNLDMRSVDADALAALEASALKAIDAAADAAGATVELVRIGDRPAGKCGSQFLVDAAREAVEKAGVKFKTNAGSTDANAAMAIGMPALCFGVYRGGNAHRVDEWVDPGSLETGLHAWREFVARLTRFKVD